MTHHLLYWLGIVWWSMGLVCAQLLHMSKTCLLLMCSQWSGGSSAHSAVHPWLFIASSYFLISHPFMACSLWGWALFDYGLSFIQPVLVLFFAVLYFLPYHSVIPAVMSYDPSLLGFFGPTACSSLNDSVWLLGFLLHYLRAPVSYLFPLGHPWPICFPWASLALFPNSAFPWYFTNSFRLPWPNYIIFHSWGSWACHQPPNFLCLHYFVLAVTHSHFSTLHTAHEFATSLSPGSFRPICFLKAHLFMLWAYDPLFLLL